MPAEAERARTAAETAARRSYGRLVAFLSARTRDVAAAEDALSEAFAAALSQWPKSGVPQNPEGWLMAVAKRRGADAARRRRTGDAARPHLTLLAEEVETMAEAQGIPDDRLRLMFACAHPAIERSVRAPLILQTILGFDAVTIAQAFLVPPSTMAQRLVRAKGRIRQAGVPFRVPEGDELDERLDAVLEAIYAAFAEGWHDPAGAESRRRVLAGEAIWLGRLALALMPDAAEAHGLLALMLFAEARRGARRDRKGDYVPLAEQDTKLWDGEMIDEAESLLTRASALDGVGRYQFEAAVQSAHAARRFTGLTDWTAIAALYRALLQLSGSVVVAINHAVALAETGMVAEAVAELDRLGDDPRLAAYQPYWAARARLLARLGDVSGADEAYSRAIGLESDPAVRRFLQEKRDSVRVQPSPSNSAVDR